VPTAPAAKIDNSCPFNLMLKIRRNENEYNTKIKSSHNVGTFSNIEYM